MIVLINGSFGVGKTTVAKLLVERLPKSILFNPENIGFVIKRLPDFIHLNGRRNGDYQDVLLWRRLSVSAALFLHKYLARTIIIPMAFCRIEYLNEFRFKFNSKSVTVNHFCLTAPVEVIYERLRKRGTHPSSDEGRWIYSRVEKCCLAHLAPEFSQHIKTDEKSAIEIAEEIIEKIYL